MMYRKVIILEIKNSYCLAMTEEGEILRIVKKPGVQVGVPIYILPEDRYEASETRHRRQTGWWRILAAAAVLALCLTGALMQQTGDYAVVSLDNKVQLQLSGNHEVKEAWSYDGSVTETTLASLQGQTLEEAVETFRTTNPDPTDHAAVIGYALCRIPTEERENALRHRLETIFGDKMVLYFLGHREDLEQAEQEHKSLGFYLAAERTESYSVEAMTDFLEQHSDPEALLDFLRRRPDLMQDPVIGKKINACWKQLQQSHETESEDTDEDEIEDWEERREEKYTGSAPDQEPVSSGGLSGQDREQDTEEEDDEETSEDSEEDFDDDDD